MSEQKQRTTILGLTIFMAVLVTLMFLRSYIFAGDINPPASPAPTMDMPEDIYTVSRTLPKPENVTIITKQLTPSPSVWKTIHTVSTGTTFYLMGISCSASDATFRVSLDGSTPHFDFEADHNINRNLISSYPMGSAPEGTAIMGRVDGSREMVSITIWGYEKTNS